LVGYAVGDSFTFSSTISYSHASGNVTTGPRSFSGGLVGFLDIFSVFQSYATGNVVSTKPNRWGTFGGLSGGLGQYANINDTYSTGYVSTGSTSWMGGYAGYSQAGHIGTSYSIGQVRNGFPAGRAPPPAQAAVGGFIGRFVSGGATLDYWDVDTSGYAKGCDKKCSGVQGLSDAQLKSQLPAGFDPTIWGQNPSVNNGYPYLLANPPS
jgi:hypothetical protein